MIDASASSAYVSVSFPSSSVRLRVCSCGLFSTLATIGDSVGMNGVLTSFAFVVVFDSFAFRGLKSFKHDSCAFCKFNGINYQTIWSWKQVYVCVEFRKYFFAVISMPSNT